MMAPPRRHGDRPREQPAAIHPGHAQPTAAEAIATQARTQAATTRPEKKASAAPATLPAGHA
jgi:hypothetical protein